MGVDLGRRPRWRTVGASVAGTAHAGVGEPCADACAARVVRAGGGKSLLVVVVADGAGTSERAGEGARLACEAILQQAELWGGEARAGRRGNSRHLSAFGREDVLLWIEAARRRIEAAAASQGLDRRDFSCTLLVALVDESSAVFFQIGDGAIVYRDREGTYRPALWPQSGEYANCTWFVTDEDAAERVQSAAAEGVHEVALLTDGLQGLALRFASREAHAPFFEPLFVHLRQKAGRTLDRLVEDMRAFLDSPPVNRRTDDDKTLVLATRLAARKRAASKRAAPPRAPRRTRRRRP